MAHQISWQGSFWMVNLKACIYSGKIAPRRIVGWEGSFVVSVTEGCEGWDDRSAREGAEKGVVCEVVVACVRCVRDTCDVKVGGRRVGPP